MNFEEKEVLQNEWLSFISWNLTLLSHQKFLKAGQKDNFVLLLLAKNSQDSFKEVKKSHPVCYSISFSESSDLSDFLINILIIKATIAHTNTMIPKNKNISLNGARKAWISLIRFSIKNLRILPLLCRQTIFNSGSFTSVRPDSPWGT